MQLSIYLLVLALTAAAQDAYTDTSTSSSDAAGQNVMGEQFVFVLIYCYYYLLASLPILLLSYFHLLKVSIHSDLFFNSTGMNNMMMITTTTTESDYFTTTTTESMPCVETDTGKNTIDFSSQTSSI